MTPCKTCELIARLWDCIHRAQFWDVVHSYNTALPGWLVLVARRHIAEMAEHSHVHFHVVARMAVQPENRRGAQIFG